MKNWKKNLKRKENKERNIKRSVWKNGFKKYIFNKDFIRKYILVDNRNNSDNIYCNDFNLDVSKIGKYA